MVVSYYKLSYSALGAQNPPTYHCVPGGIIL